jgi:hypothetical protein
VVEKQTPITAEFLNILKDLKGSGRTKPAKIIARGMPRMFSGREVDLLQEQIKQLQHELRGADTPTTVA